MADQNSESQKSVVNALLSSGFPFQTAVAGLVRSLPECKVIFEEFPWRDERGEDRFLDLVVIRHRFVVTIECKKTQKDILTFLQPGRIDGDINRARCLYLTQIKDSTKRMELCCGDWLLMPKSAESKFCVVSTSNSGKDQRLLERDAQLLVRGTDAYARHYKKSFNIEHDPETDRPILPVLVTNAEIFLGGYNPSEVSLDSGQLTPNEAALSHVEHVRFRKAFSTSEKDIGDRTVFIVRASKLGEWLAKLDFVETLPSREGRVFIH